jgi:hypothetical protein
MHTYAFKHLVFTSVVTLAFATTSCTKKESIQPATTYSGNEENARKVAPISLQNQAAESEKGFAVNEDKQSPKNPDLLTSDFHLKNEDQRRMIPKGKGEFHIIPTGKVLKDLIRSKR